MSSCDHADVTDAVNSTSTESKKKSIVFVTTNKGKLEEVRTYLSSAAPSIVVRHVALDLPELQCATAADVSYCKAVEAYRTVNGCASDERLKPNGIPVVVEDTCLGFDCLNGLPGPYVKWFLQTIGPSGLVKMTNGFCSEDRHDMSHRRATASCIFSYCYGVDSFTGEAKVEQFEGVVHGILVDTPRGSHGFGWDSVFAPDEQKMANEKTYAEMDLEEKNTISHRTRALKSLQAYLLSHQSEEKSMINKP